MRLSWNEIRSRAAHFSREWADAKYEKGETQSFYNDFFEVFGVKRRRVATYEEPVKLLGDKRGFIDLFWKGMLLVEQKSAGRSLKKAKSQALDYFPGLKEADLPRYVLVSDFQTFDLYDLDEDRAVSFTLADLHLNIHEFGFILGVERRTFKDQDPVNIAASELMGRLHDALKASGYTGHDLERLLVRLVFCLFADTTGIFEPRGIFNDLIQQRTAEDGSDTGRMLIELFEVLNKEESKRQKTLDEDLAAFPYVNGDLFAERLPTPAFDNVMRLLLIEACQFNWDAISPAIFGSLFQSVMNAEERRATGGHYTTEKNIMKVIQPLFLDAMKAEFERLKANRGTRREADLRAFHLKLSKLTFFDPACGCGNFLIIAYRELRLIELELLREIVPQGQLNLNVDGLSKINVNQFYGIEIGEFAARIAETALWMMDHIMNNRLSLEFIKPFRRIPLKASPHIHCADALEIDWAKVLPPDDCSYVFGNPPFIGAKQQSDKQRSQVRDIAKLGGAGGTLDYVCAWFLKASAYVQKSPATIGFVATNSITQGEQVAQLWPVIFDRFKLELAFAHRTFAWGSDARGMAHVHVVILGLVQAANEPKDKRLFSYDDIKGDPVETRHASLSPYLFDASGLADRHLVVQSVSRSLSGAPKMITGSKPLDGNHYVFSDDEKRAFLKIEPKAKSLFHPYFGADEYINNWNRWVLNFDSISSSDLRKLPHVMKRISAVRALRKASDSKPTQAIADQPTRYHVNVVPKTDFLVVPNVSSERREYAPIGWLKPPIIPNQKLRLIPNADLWHFAILTSRMHMAWMRAISGRLESRYMYSVGVCYNPFPWPIADDKTKAKCRQLAQAILDARAAHADEALADLYDPDVMPSDLRRAHRALDAAVDKLYRAAAFSSDRERVEHLFGLYEKLVTPLAVAAHPKVRRAPRRAAASPS